MSAQGPGPGRVPGAPTGGRRAAVARRWDRLGVRSRLRTLLPAAADRPPDDEAGRRGLAMGLSVVVAAVLWFSFNMREVYTVAVEMPVEVVALPADQALRERPPATATATLQGDGWTLLALTRRRPTIQVAATGETVDLAEAAAREQALADVAVRNVQPGAIELALDARTTRRLPIRLRQSIETRPPFGLLRPPTLRPDSVTVFGAQSILGRLSDWPTETFVVRDLNDNVTRTVALSDTLAGLVVPSVRSTTVSVAVGQFTRAVRDLDVEVVGLPAGVEGVRFDPARVTVEYDVPSEGEAFDEAARSAAFRAVVDWSDIARDTTSGSVPVSLRVPGGLGVRDPRARPGRVEYFLVRRPAPAPAGR